MPTQKETKEEDWFSKITHKLVALFFVRDKGAKYLNPFTLNFIGEQANLEKSFVAFHNESSLFYVILSAIVAVILMLLYLILDTAFPDEFFKLLLVRVVSVALIIFLILLVLLSKKARRKANYFATSVLFLGIASGSFTLYLRDDIDFSPYFMSLLWVHMHFGANFIVERTITGFILILTFTFFWIFFVGAVPLTFLNTQSLTYLMFFAGAVLSAYGREIAVRHVYLQIHNLIPQFKKSPSFLNMTSNNNNSAPPSPAIPSRRQTISSPAPPTLPPPSSSSLSPSQSNTPHPHPERQLVHRPSAYPLLTPSPSPSPSPSPTPSPHHSPRHSPAHPSSINFDSPDNLPSSVSSSSSSSISETPSSSPFVLPPIGTTPSNSSLSVPTITLAPAFSSSSLSVPPILFTPSTPPSSPKNRVAPAPASAPPSPSVSSLHDHHHSGYLSLSVAPPSPSPSHSPSSSPTLAIHSSLSSPTPPHTPHLSYLPPPNNSYLRERDWFDDAYEKGVKLLAQCLPANYHNRKSSVVKDVHYHKEVEKYVSMRSFRFTQNFCDPEREEKFSEWHRKTTELSVRRFFLLNIISTVLLITHDLSFDLTSSELSIVIGLRFGVIVPSLFFCFFFGSLYPPTKQRRGAFNTLLELICTATSFVVGILIWRFVSDSDEVEGAGAYDLYFGITSRYLIYGFSGMGLRWIPSSVVGGGLTLVFVFVGVVMGFSLSIFSIFVAVVGITLAFTEERVKRIEFIMHFYQNEVISHLEGKTVERLIRQGSLTNVMVSVQEM